MPRTWLITGSSRGLGRALAEAALAASENVVATARHPDQLQDLVGRYPGSAKAVRLAVTDRAQAAAAVEATTDVFGRLDVLVNNAGYANVNSIEDFAEDDFRAQIETNLWGVINHHPGRRACPPRAVFRPHPADLLGRRARHDAGNWPLSDGQVGCGGLLRGAPQEARSARDPRDADRAWWCSHRLGRCFDARRRHP